MWTRGPGAARAAHLSAAESLRSPLLQQPLVMGTFGFDRVPRQLAQAFLHVARVRRCRRCGGEPCRSRTTIPGKRVAKGHRLWLAVIPVERRRVGRKGREVNGFLKDQWLACGGAAMAAGFQWPALPAARPLPRWTIVSATAAVGHRVRFLPESAPGPGWVLRRRCPSCFVPADPDCGGTPCCSYVCSVRQRPSPRHWVAGAPPWRRAGARSTRTTVRASWWAWALHDGSVRVAWKAVWWFCSQWRFWLRRQDQNHQRLRCGQCRSACVPVRALEQQQCAGMQSQCQGEREQIGVQSRPVRLYSCSIMSQSF